MRTIAESVSHITFEMKKFFRRRSCLAVLSLMAAVISAPAQTEPPHPILSISSNNGSSANTILSTWTEAQYTNNFVPHWAPRNEDYGFGSAVVSGDTGWSWSSSNPNQITSTPSGTIFPTTTNYLTHTQAVTVFSGNTVNAPYYLKAGSTTSKTFVFNIIDYHKVGKLRGDLDSTLDGAYIGSGTNPGNRNDAYARRVAVALLDWARYMPDWTLTGKNSASFINTSPSYILSSDLQRGSDHNGLAHEWDDNEIKAFDAIYDSVALTNLSNELGFDVRNNIKSNLFFNEGDFIVNHVPVDVAIQSNLSGPYAILPEVARVLDRPDYIIWMDTYLDATVRQKIRRDGVLEEGMGYSIGYLNSNQDAAQNTHDYFLTRGATNALLLAISNRATAYNASLKYGQNQWAAIALPNGQLPSFGDTPFNTYFTARNNGASMILPAYGSVSMGAGSSSGTAVQVNQNFPGDNNHMRSDTLAYVLWAFNNEYLGNIRYYNGAIGRNFDEQMLSHNTITIDRVNETFPDADTYGDGDLTLYEPGNNGLAMTEVDGQRDYSNKASRFQRLLFLNTADLNKPYVLDVFRVTGGTTHDYLLHGAIRWDQNGSCSFPLVTNTQTYPMLEGSETWDLSSDTPYYGFWRGVSSNTAPGNFFLTYSDANRTTGRDTRLWMTADPNTYNVYLGWTPTPARDNTVPTNFFNYLNLKRPSAIIRHRIPSGTLQDLFVSVIEPINAGVSNIVSVDRLAMNGSSLESCGVKITFADGRIDTYIVNLQNPAVAGASGGSATVSTVDGQYSLTGRVGAFMDRTSGDPRVWTMNATDFQYPHRHFTTPNTYYSGLIAGSTRKYDGASNDAFTTTSPLPVGTSLRNKFLSFTHGSLNGSGTTGISEMFRIDQVIFTNGVYNVCFTNDHMLEITNGTTSVEQVAPLRSFTGSNSFEIALGGFAGQISPLADLTLAPGASSGPISFTFGNLGSTSGSSLQVLASSSDQTVVPNGNLVIGGSGTNRTLTVTTAANSTGSALITVSVTDGVWTNSRSFTVTESVFQVTGSPASQTVLLGGSTNFTATVTATNGFNGLVTFGVTGVPSGASGSFTPPTITGPGSSTLTVTTTTNVSPGTYPLALTATSGSLSSTSTVSLTISAVTALPGSMVWNIGGAPANSNWSAAFNWTNTTAGGFGPPGISNDVVFNNTGAVGTNSVDNIVDSDTTISSLTYANTNSYHTTLIAPGKTLTIIGNKGLLVGTETDLGTNVTVNAGITGPGGTLAFSATNGNVVVRQWTAGASGGIQRSTFDLSGLDTFNATGNAVRVGFWDGTGTARSAGTLYLARTNTLNLFARGQNVTTNAGIDVGDNPLANSSQSSFLYLGQVNTLNVDGITVGGGRQIGWMSFNPALVNPSVTIRGTNGPTSRVTRWLVGDNSGASNTGSNSRGTNDFTGGTVDALVNTMILGKGESPTMNTGNSTGSVTFAQGTIDVNTLQLGVQTPGSTGGGAGTVGSTNYVGVMNVNGSGTLVVNSNLILSSLAGGAGGYNLVGILTLNGGTVQAVNITNGGGSAQINLNSGTLDLQPSWAAAPGKLVNISTLAIGTPGGTDPAMLTNAATLSTPAALIVSSNGILAGNTVVTSPQLVLNGAISPGTNGPGAMTNSGSIAFGAGGHYFWQIKDGAGTPGTAWSFVQSSSGLDVQAASGNPFTIQAAVFGELVPGDLPDFDNNTPASWPIAAGTGVTNFAASKFTVDAGGFVDDLAGGYFYVTTFSNSLWVAFTNNHPPVATDALNFYAGGVLQISIASLAPHWSDADGDPVRFVSVNGSSANGANNVSTDGTYIYYTNTAPVADTITYTVSDVRTNPPAVYRPGDTVRTGTALIQILPPLSISGFAGVGTNLVWSGSNGLPGGNYYVLMSTNISVPLSNWSRVATNAFDGTGNFQFTNTPDAAGAGRQFYLLQLP